MQQKREEKISSGEGISFFFSFLFSFASSTMIVRTRKKKTNTKIERWIDILYTETNGVDDGEKTINRRGRALIYDVFVA